jgi:mRNA interferase RelE/StbE
MFSVSYSKQAKRFLQKSTKVLAKRLFAKIEILREKPVLHDSKPVEGFKEKLFRVRVGDYRILYEVDHSGNLTGIVKIDKRGKVCPEWM